MYMMSCNIDSAAEGTFTAAGTGAEDFSFIVQGLSRIICWEDSSMGEGDTDMTSRSCEKDPVKSNFILSIFCCRIFTALIRTIASESQLSSIYCIARLASLSHTGSVCPGGY